VLDSSWYRRGNELILAYESAKWRDHRQRELQQVSLEVSNKIPKGVSLANRKQFFEDSLQPAEAMRLSVADRTAITESYHSPLSFWHTEILAEQDPIALAKAMSNWETVVFSSSPSLSEKVFDKSELDRMLNEARTFAEWIAGWQERLTSPQRLVALNLERFVDAAPKASELRHSLECRPGLIVSSVALYDRSGTLLHEDSRIIAISRSDEPRRDVADSLGFDPVLLKPDQRKALAMAGLTRWVPNDAAELLAGFGEPESPLWQWRDLIGETLARKYPDRPILMWIPDAELLRLAKFIKGDQLDVADYLRARLAEPGGLSLTISDKAVIVRPDLLGEALDGVLPKDAVVAFALAAKRNHGFRLEAELRLAAAADGYLYSPILHTIRRLAAFIPFVWPYAPAEERAIWALSHVVKGGLDGTRFPLPASTIPADTLRALYAMRGRAGSTIIAGQELAPTWSGAITSRWPKGIPGTATFTLDSVETPVIRQRLNRGPWSSPSEPSSIGLTLNQILVRQFWPGYRNDRNLLISDGQGAQIKFPIIDGFTFDEARQGADYDDLPTTHRPVILDPDGWPGPG